ncbi:hypothetical protein PENSPDRAFT_759826, partial [Peniophora sp. CONT]
MVSHKDYSAELSEAYPDRGHPIADPQPGFVPKTKTFLPRVDLGDVGYIQHNHGRFIRLFNVHKEPGVDGQPSRDKLPAGFEVLDREEVPLQEGELNKKLFKSKSVSLNSVDAGVSGPSLVPLQGTFNFKKTRQRGAILVTPGPERISTIDASPKGVKVYKLYSAKHMPNWITFFEDEGLDRGDLILVTGVDLVISWATAAFTSSSTEAGLGLDIEYVTVGGVQAAAKFSWDHDQAAMSNSTPLTQNGPNTELNQTIFIRRLRAKRRGFLGIALRANAEPRDPDLGDDTDSDGDIAGELVEQPNRGEFIDTLTPIMDYILQHSEAQVAIAHDEDVAAYNRLLVGGLQNGLNLTVTENAIGIVNPESTSPQHSVMSLVDDAGRQDVGVPNDSEADPMDHLRARLQGLVTHHDEVDRTPSARLPEISYSSPQTSPVVTRLPGMDHGTRDRQSPSAIASVTLSSRQDPWIPSAARHQHPAWLQRAIDSGYRLEPSADRRNAMAPLFSSDNNRSWTLDAQYANFTIDTQRMIILPPHLSDTSHGDGDSPTSEASYVSTSHQRRDLYGVSRATTPTAAPAPRRGLLKRIFSSSDPTRVTGTPPTDGRPKSTSQNSQGRPILHIPESQKMDYALQWQLLPFNAQSGKPRLYFDIRFASEYASYVRDGQGHFNIPRSELEKLATKKGLPDMTFCAWDLPIFDIEVHRPEGVRVCDVLERIHENYQLVLTRTEKALHCDRVDRAQSFYEERVRHERALNPAYADLGMRRIDLLEGKVVFIGCQWRHPCQEYPEGSWTMLFLPPPRRSPSSAPVQTSRSRRASIDDTNDVQQAGSYAHAAPPYHAASTTSSIANTTRSSPPEPEPVPAEAPELVPPVLQPALQQASASTRLPAEINERESPTRPSHTPSLQTPWIGRSRLPQTSPDITAQAYPPVLQ